MINDIMPLDEEDLKQMECFNFSPWLVYTDEMRDRGDRKLLEMFK